jgi:hypothetical protein
MPKQATAADAQAILHLYDLRREAEMRKARNWWAGAFWPQTPEDFLQVLSAFGTPENAWLRQVMGYWDMAAVLALHGAIPMDLFLEGAVSGEMFFLYAKVQPFLKELRKKMQSPGLFANIEKVILGSKAGRERLKIVSARVASRRKAMTESKAAD